MSRACSPSQESLPGAKWQGRPQWSTILLMARQTTVVLRRQRLMGESRGTHSKNHNR